MARVACPAVQLILVRHGQPIRVHNADGTIADPELSELGREQAELVCGWLAYESVDHVITSPKRRAIETVRPLLDTGGATHEIVTDLDEIDIRSTTYLPTELLAAEGGDYWDAIVRGDYEAIGWDSPEVFGARVDRAFAELVRNPRGDIVVVACHGGVIRRIVAEVLGIGTFARIEIGYASTTRLRVDAEGKASILTLNEAAHFEATRYRVVGSSGTRPH
jgi:probable phosphoglycerate mutase